MFKQLAAVILSLFSLTPSPAPISLQSIFSPSHPAYKNLFSQTTTIVFTGDVMLGRSINAAAVRNTDFAFPFTATRDLLATADVASINLETPLPAPCPVTLQGMVFCGNQRWTAGLADAGIDIVNLANNHTYNYGSAGLTATVDALTALNLKPIGLGQPEIITVNGTSFAFLGFNAVGGSRPPIAAVVSSDITAQVSAAQKQADVVIAQFHWGQEYRTQPTSDQRRLAHLAIDSGADLVLGHHPHWIQSVEIYSGVPVIYSLGNFVFDQYWSQATRQGLVVRATFQNHQLADIRLIPIVIDLSGRPAVAPPELAESILTQLRQASVE